MNEKQGILSLDRLGMCACFICMVHCLAVPLLLIIGLESALAWVEQEWIEHTLLFSSLVIGLMAFWGGFRKHKQHYIPILFVAGFLLLLNGEGVVNTTLGIILSVSGASLIAYAHIQNLKWKAHASTVR